MSQLQRVQTGRARIVTRHYPSTLPSALTSYPTEEYLCIKWLSFHTALWSQAFLQELVVPRRPSSGLRSSLPTATPSLCLFKDWKLGICIFASLPPTPGPGTSFRSLSGVQSLAVFKKRLNAYLLGLLQKLSWGVGRIFLQTPPPPGDVSALINPAPLWIKYALTLRTSYPPPVGHVNKTPSPP